MASFGNSALPSSQPLSPLTKTHDRINSYLVRLQALGIDVQPRDTTWSPSTSREPIAGPVKFLYYKNQPGLEKAIRSLEDRSNSGEKLSNVEARIMFAKLQKEVQSAQSVQSVHSVQIGLSSSAEAVLSRTEFSQRLKASQTSTVPPSPTEHLSEESDSAESLDGYQTAPQSPSPSARKRKSEADDSMRRDAPGFSLAFDSFESRGPADIWDNPLNRSGYTEKTDITEPDSDSGEGEVGGNVDANATVNAKIDINFWTDGLKAVSEYQPTSAGARNEPASSGAQWDLTVSQAQGWEGMSSQAYSFRSHRLTRGSDMTGTSSERYTNDSAMHEAMIEMSYIADLDLAQNKGKQPLRSVLPMKNRFLQTEPNIRAKHNIYFRYDMVRLWTPNDPKISRIMKDFKNSNGDHHQFLNTLSVKFGRPLQRSSERVLRAAFNENEDTKKLVTFSALLEPGTSSSRSAFRFVLQPLKLELGCCFQRKFQSHRFLFVSIPDLRKLYNLQHFIDWLMEEHKFLDRFWRAVFIKPIKNSRKKNQKKKKEEVEYSFQVTFFAVRGEKIEQVSVEEFVHWYIPFHLPDNKNMTFLKAYARLELGFSQCTPTISFNPDLGQEISTEDTLPDNQLEATQYNDPDHTFTTPKGDFMDDGCNTMSVAASLEISNELGVVGMLPSVFQGRVNAAKGVWIRNHSTDSSRPEEQEVQIRISGTQRKFAPHADFDKDRCGFEVVKTSKKAQPSKLHKSFILILMDRGVSFEAIVNCFERGLAVERSVTMQAIGSVENLVKWLPRVTTDSIDEAFPGDVPTLPPLKVKDRLECGFDPQKNLTLATVVRELVRRHLMINIERFGVTVANSTYVLGIADPYSILKPGEIFLSFSHGFPVDHHRYQYLNDKEVLVSRHPAIRPSDMQKVKAVFRQGLEHIQDVVVFPSVGCVSLASKLAGGDYDGDQFWVCWEPELVKGFLNAPAPVTAPIPEDFGITVNRQKVSDMVGPPRGAELPSLNNFMRHAFGFSLAPSLLGQVTNYHERYCYNALSICDPKAVALADLHDLLVDSAKNGYTFTEANFAQFKKKHQLPQRPFSLAYEDAAKAWIEDTPKRKGDWVGGSPQKKATPVLKYNKNHPLDKLVFEVIRPHIDETLRMVDDEFKKAEDDVSALLRPADDLKKAHAGGGMVYNQLKVLEQRIWELDERDKLLQKSNKNRTEVWEDRVNSGREGVSLLEPDEIQDPLLREHWLRKIGSSPSFWELIKASLFTAIFRGKPELANELFWRELGYLQAYQSANGANPVVPNVWAQMKPKKFVLQEGELEGLGPSEESGNGGSFGDEWDYE